MKLNSILIYEKNYINPKLFENKICYICSEPIEYFFQFTCKCHNYLHDNCIDIDNLEKCIICKKNTFVRTRVNFQSENIFTNNEIFNIDLTIDLLAFVKLKEMTDIMYDWVITYKNIIQLPIYIIYIFTICFGLICPLGFLNILFRATRILNAEFKNKI